MKFEIGDIVYHEGKEYHVITYCGSKWYTYISYRLDNTENGTGCMLIDYAHNNFTKFKTLEELKASCL